MNRNYSIFLVVIVFLLGFLLRGCCESAVVEQQSDATSTQVSTSINSVLAIARDSVSSLTVEIEDLKKAIGKSASSSKVVVYETVHDTIWSSTRIPSIPKVVKVRDTAYIDSSKLAAHTFDFRDSFLFARVSIENESASIDSIGIFNEMRMVVSEIPINKYVSQKIVLFSPTNPYVSSYSHGYTELPRYTDLGIAHLKKKAKRNGLFWGVLGTAAVATTYFLIQR